MSHTTLPTLAQSFTPSPLQIDDQASINETKELLQKHHIHHLIVTADGDMCGLVSDRDLQRHDKLYGMCPTTELMVRDIFDDRMVVADINDPLNKVLDVMVTRQLDCVVILNEGELCGIFTTTDACRAFSQHLQQCQQP